MTALKIHSQRKALQLAAVACAAFVAVFALLLKLHVGGELGRLVLSDVVLLIPLALAGAGCFWAARRVRGRTRLAWLLVGTGWTGYAIGGCIWAFYEIVLHTEVPFPSWADPFYLSVFPFAIVGLLVFPGAPSNVTSRLRSIFDGLIVAGSLLFIAWTLVLSDVIETSEGSLLSQALGLAYPIGDLVLLTLALVAAVRVRHGRRQPFALLALGLLVFTLTDYGFAYLSSQQLYASGSLIDAGWAATGLLVMLAGLAQDREDGAEVSERTGRWLWVRTVLPYVVLLPAMTLGVVRALSGNDPDAFGWALGVALLAMLVLRQFLMLAENVLLTQELRTTVDDLRTAESDMRHQAFHDALTGLANRALFKDRISHAVVVAQRQAWEIAVLFLDLDDFKLINDSLGHEAGDDLLVAVAARLQSCLRGADTAARMGGDEFAALLEDGGKLEALRVAQRISTALDQPFQLAGREVMARASVGIAVPDASFPTNVEELLRHADLAMYSSKAAGKGRASLYQEAMGLDLGERLGLKTDLTRALLGDEFAVYFQPVVDLTTGRVTSLEALARWHHPQRGLLPAEEFIGLAGESGLIVPLGQKMVSLTCSAIRSWYRQNPRQALPPVSVNLSGRQLGDPNIADDISAALLEYELEPAALILEITENTLTSDTAAVVARLHALRALGVRLAIDNFGTGQSSLASLDQFPVDILKLDRTFVASMTETVDGDRRGLAAAVLRLGAMLGLQTIACGVEQPWQLQRLQQLGCTAAQGYQLSHPRPAAEMNQLLRVYEVGNPAVSRHR